MKEAITTATSIDTIRDCSFIKVKNTRTPNITLKISLELIFILVLYVFLWGCAMGGLTVDLVLVFDNI
jgi:hypothetical protein